LFVNKATSPPDKITEPGTNVPVPLVSLASIFTVLGVNESTKEAESLKAFGP